MNDPAQRYRDAVATLLAASDRTVAAEHALDAARESEQEARQAKVQAERALHKHILSNPPQQLPLGVTQQ